MIEQFINFVIRPPRAAYDPDQYLWGKFFTLAGRDYKREDLELINGRGQTLRCSHYVPSTYPADFAFPCVIYCHGNSGCRADANEAAVVLLPANITLFTLDFSGSGLSDGDFVSLGWHEKNDLGAAVSYLRNNKRVSHIGLWGRSMGAVTGLLYGSEDPSISGMVLDSAFSNLFDLMMELVDVYKIRLPKFTVKVAMQYMRRVILKRANFDIKDLKCLQAVEKMSVPALFAHANGDKFVQPHHSDIIFKHYAGEKNIIKFDGDHNSPRPQFYYDSISIFFYNTLKPPQKSPVWSNKVEECHGPRNLRVAGYSEELLYEIISNLHIASNDAASSSTALGGLSAKESVEDILSEIAPATGTNDKVDIDDCCSYTSSNRESWGRCSSVEGSDPAECTAAISNQQVVYPPLSSSVPPDLEISVQDEIEKETVVVAPAARNKPKHEKLERLGSYGRRLRLSILRQVKHKKFGS